MPQGWQAEGGNEKTDQIKIFHRYPQIPTDFTQTTTDPTDFHGPKSTTVGQGAYDQCNYGPVAAIVVDRAKHDHVVRGARVVRDLDLEAIDPLFCYISDPSGVRVMGDVEVGAQEAITHHGGQAIGSGLGSVADLRPSIEKELDPSLDVVGVGPLGVHVASPMRPIRGKAMHGRPPKQMFPA